MFEVRSDNRYGKRLATGRSLLMTVLIGGLVAGNPVWLNGFAWQETKPPEEPGPTTEETVLPWQPGLGRPPATTPGPGTSGTATPIPLPATPLPGAQPLPVTPPGTGAATAQASAIPAVPQTTPGNWPVTPAALIQPDPGASGETATDPGNTKVTRGLDQLPNSAGQVWRTYDISPYTYMVGNSERPQQALIDWIVHETGKDMWFSEPLGILSANRDRLHVYHTPAIQARIKPIVDRFVASRAAPHVVGLRLATVASPNWRSQALSMMQPISIEAPGVEAWLMSRENAAILLGQLRNRSDYQEHNNADMVVTDGQKYILSRTQPIDFTRSMQWVNQGGGYYQPVVDRFEQGYKVEFSALTSVDGRTMEGIVGCEIDQIEQLQPVTVQLPGLAGQTQTAQLQIPQVVSWRANERFRWPSDQVLVLGCGVVAMPGPQRQALLGLPSMLNGSQGRADALMFIEYKGRAAARSAAAGR